MKHAVTLLFLPMWLIFAFSKLLKRDKSIIVFGTHTTSFSGNIKTLFLQKESFTTKKIFITPYNKLIKELSKNDYIVYSKYSLKGIWYTLRAGTYIYSSYPSDINFWLSGGAKYINVWHGTPIKKIERDVTTGKYSLKNRYNWAFKVLKPYLLVKPDLLLVASKYEESCFKSAFDIKTTNLFRTFPPRLEALLSLEEKSNTIKNVLYVPTWRDDHSYSFTDHVNLETFNHFLQTQNMIFYIKLHPSDNNLHIETHYSNLKVIAQDKDIYETLTYTDLLVSDYSSMVFEALYLSKPVILFCPDYKSYQKKSREFYIDPCTNLPLKVSYTQKELENKLMTSKVSHIDRIKSKSYEPYPIQKDLLLNIVERVYNY